jgi:trigger factor
VEVVKGKTARFEITVRELRTQVTPELDDAFAKEIGGGDTVEQMRQKVRTEMLAAEKAKTAQADRDELVEELLKRNPFDVPRAMVDRAIDGMLQAALRNMARSGVDPSQLRLNFESLREELREKATTEVKATLALEAIGQKENVQVEDADVKAKVQELSQQTGSPPETLQQALNDPGVKRQFFDKLREEKTIEFLKSRAKY